MGINIEDGVGRGYQVKVTRGNRLVVEASTFDVIHVINHIDGEAYSLTFAVTPAGAGNCFCYIKNGSTIDLNINSITISAAADEVVQIKLRDTGTPAGGSTATPVNRNTNSNNLALGTFLTGTNITGLSGGSIVDQFFSDGATNSQKYSWASSLIVAQNSVLALYAVNGAIALRITIAFFNHEAD